MFFSQINSGALVLQWWTQAVPGAVWVALIILGSTLPLSICIALVVPYRDTLISLVTGVNFSGVRFLGEVEFWFSSVKVIALIGLILFGILVDAGVNPKRQTIGFTNYRPPNGPFGSYLEDKVGTGDISRFLGVCSVMSA